MPSRFQPHWPARPVRIWALALLALMTYVAAPPSAQAKRLALLIGNQDYQHEKTLTPNPGNDVALLGRVFKDELKFDDVQVLTNQSAEGIERAVDALVRKGQGADVLVFYYSGHGMKSPDRRNFLLPVEARIELPDTYTIKRQAVAAEDIREQLKSAGATVTLLLLDACRDGPGGGKSGTKGLARMEGGRGLLIGYATEEDRVADNGSNGNSPYALGLAAAFRQKHKPILAQLDEAGDVVKRLTDGRQEPTRDGNLRTDAFLVASISPVPVPPGAPAPAPAGVDLVDLERADQQERANRVQWAQWQQAMQAAFDKVGQLGTDALQIKGWERFISNYGGQNNPYSSDDEALISQARQAMAQSRLQQEQNLVGIVSGATGTFARTRPASSFKDCDVCPEMEWLPPGQFEMGSPFDEAGHSRVEGPLHSVQINYRLAVGKYAVTFDEWAACVSDGGCGSNPRPSDNEMGRGRRPVINLSWNDAKGYTAWLKRKTGKSYRLLSESEWEYAARARTSTPFYTGRCVNPIQANYWGIYDYGGCGNKRDERQPSKLTTSPVGQFASNEFGLYDMIGNVWQWTEDTWHDNYSEAPNDGSSWTSRSEKLQHFTDQEYRVVRGGSYQATIWSLRSAYRSKNLNTYSGGDIGCRVARTE